jgi:hypothetical protein
MDIKSVLLKLLKGEEISSDERQFAEGFDLQKQIDGAQAAARKKLEKRLSEVETERDEIKAKVTELEEAANAADAGNGTEVEKLSKELDKLKKSLADKDVAIESQKAEKAAYVRDVKVGRLLCKIKLVDGLDPDLPKMALERLLKGVETDDLDDDGVVSPILEKFSSTNKALVLDSAAGGGGTPPKGGTNAKPSNDPTKMSDTEREADLRKQGII